MSLGVLIGLVLAAVSTTLTNLAYAAEHDAAAELPCLSLRRPLHSAALLIHDRSWLRGFATESGGFALYAAALALASLTVVQSIEAGGIGVLAFISSRRSGRRLGPRRRGGVLLSTVGLVALAVSLERRPAGGGHGSAGGILLWLAVTALAAGVVLGTGRGRPRSGIAQGLAGGLLFSIGDISTKLATQGGIRVVFVVTLIAGYLLGTSLIQIGYQRDNALTVAGLATLATNAVPILFGTIVLHEPVPPGLWGGLRVLAYLAVVAGAIMLAHPDAPAGATARVAADRVGSPGS
jgi:hypothetical protein